MAIRSSEALDMHGPEQGGVPVARWRRAQAGQGILEVAITFPLLALMVMAIGAVAWTFWVQSAGAIASVEAARYSAYRSGESINPTAGYGPFSDAMSGIAGEAAADYIGNPQIVVDPATRSVHVSALQGATFSNPVVSAGYTFKSGTFSRMMQFFGGPPSPWE